MNGDGGSSRTRLFSFSVSFVTINIFSLFGTAALWESKLEETGLNIVALIESEKLQRTQSHCIITRVCSFNVCGVARFYKIASEKWERERKKTKQILNIFTVRLVEWVPPPFPLPAQQGDNMEATLVKVCRLCQDVCVSLPI